MMMKMGKINVKIQEDIDAKFRKEIFNRKGMKKGNITEALEEAMLLWINTMDIPKQMKKNAK